MTSSYISLHLSFKLRLFLVLSACGIIIFHLFSHEPANCSLLCPYESTLTHNRLTSDSSHVVQHYSEFICPHNFRNLADWVYGWPKQESGEELEVTTTKAYHITPCLAVGSIIFLKTDYLDEFFGKVYPYLSNRFVLITGQTDASSPGRYLSYLENDDSKIIHWFGQNGELYSSKNNKFTHIPIGKSTELISIEK